MILNESFVLASGLKIPKIGFGTWQIKPGEEAFQAVTVALKHGYRHIDTAAAYENEASVGDAIIASKLPRKKLFITTKLKSHIKGYQSTFDELEKSLKALKTDYVDLYLIHAPWPWSDMGSDHTEGNIEAWKAMIELQKQGKIKVIGVSNFSQSDIDALIRATGVTPEVNQVPIHVGRVQNDLRKYCLDHKILVEAYSPLATGRVFRIPLVNELAEKYNVSPAQIAIRFTLELNTLPLPKSIHEDRIINNAKVDFKLEEIDVEKLLNAVIERKQ